MKSRPCHNNDLFQNKKNCLKWYAKLTTEYHSINIYPGASSIAVSKVGMNIIILMLSVIHFFPNHSELCGHQCM